ncbi:hypothetical protein AGMMS4956_10080 [Bacteroidia bacterium]|nr:hypothetical protein AGMMS4956_10080 [Bacteroidia bacterium]
MKKIIGITLAVALFAACESKHDLERGDKIPCFELAGANDTTVTSAELKDNYSLLLFFATWCPYCNWELPEVQKIYDKYNSRGNFKVWAIAREQHPDTVAAFFATHNYTFSVYADTNRSVFSQFAQNGIPRTYLVGPDGIIIESIRGAERDSITGEVDMTVLTDALKEIFK